MALKLNYVARETSANLWRNLSLTVASVLTVFVSLALLGGAMLFYFGIGNATARWEGGIEFIVFMQPTSSQDELDAVRTNLEANPEVEKVTFVDKEAAFEEFKQLFKRSPEMVEAVDVEAMPPSFKVAPAISDADIIEELGKRFDGDPGVREVVFAFDTVRTLQRLFWIVRLFLGGIAGVLMMASFLLIYNTIRMAMFSRRREIEVMKLVGATNWFIRVPFMIEGLVQGLIGATFGIGAVSVMRWGLGKFLRGNSSLQIFDGFDVTGGQLALIWLAIAAGGAVIGTLGSFLAVSKYLDV